MAETGAIIKHDIKKAAPTGDWRYMKPVVDKEKCIGCATCVPYCPEASIETINREQLTIDQNEKLNVNSQMSKVANIDYDFCKGCGVCAQVCPIKAITMQKN